MRQSFRRDREPATRTDRALGLIVWPLAIVLWGLALWQPVMGIAALMGWR